MVRIYITSKKERVSFFEWTEELDCLGYWDTRRDMLLKSPPYVVNKIKDLFQDLQEQGFKVKDTPLEENSSREEKIGVLIWRLHKVLELIEGYDKTYILIC